MTNTERTIGDNSGITLPEDHAEAANWIFNRYQHLKNQRRWTQTTITNLIKDAKAHGHDPAQMRMSIRLGKMTPEQRRKWEETTAAAAALYGIKMSYSGEEIDRANPIWPVVEKAKAMHEEKASIAEQIKELFDVAKENGYNPAHFKLLSDLKAKEDDDDTGENEGHAEDWFHDLDSLGTKLGIW